jgi:hypothetical protein
MKSLYPTVEINAETNEILVHLPVKTGEGAKRDQIYVYR